MAFVVDNPTPLLLHLTNRLRREGGLPSYYNKVHNAQETKGYRMYIFFYL